MNASIANLAYGKGRVPLCLDAGLAQWHVVAPHETPALPDAQAAFGDACGNPIASPPLREVVNANDRVVIVTCDGTRALPNRLLIPWLLDALPTPDDHVTILLGNGTHRANTPEEIDAMFGADIARRVRILNHDCQEPDRNVFLGNTPSGAPIWLDKTYVEADKRIVLGFIEPHFFAGFSGGAKGVAPGVAGIESILYLHGYELIAHPSSTWGVMDGNPLRQAIQDIAATCPPEFLINVTLNGAKDITGFFAGDYVAAHAAGCERTREEAMTPVPHRFPIVVTSNSGFPLDQNLYQTVKGMSAAARIVEDGGLIIVASECSDGIPLHGNFGAMLRQAHTAEALERMVRALSEPRLDQWQVQVFANILRRCRIALFSKLDPETTHACLMTPVDDIREAVAAELDSIGHGAPVAVLPEGPLTVAYVGN